MGPQKSAEQCEVFLNFMAGHPDMAKGFTKGDRVQQDELWYELTIQLNACGPPNRDVATWKKTWCDWRRSIKKRIEENKYSLRKTGRSDYQQHYLSPVEERIANICHAVEGGKSLGPKKPKKRSSSAPVLSEENSSSFMSREETPTLSSPVPTPPPVTPVPSPDPSPRQKRKKFLRDLSRLTTTECISQKKRPEEGDGFSNYNHESSSENEPVDEMKKAYHKRRKPLKGSESSKRINLLEISSLQKETEMKYSKIMFEEEHSINEQRKKMLELQIRQMDEEHQLRIQKLKLEIEILKKKDFSDDFLR